MATTGRGRARMGRRRSGRRGGALRKRDLAGGSSRRRERHRLEQEASRQGTNL